jgi:hypothetical protein
LATAHLIGLAAQLTGSGAASTPALVGHVAGLLGCGLSVLAGLRFGRPGAR